MVIFASPGCCEVEEMLEHSLRLAARQVNDNFPIAALAQFQELYFCLRSVRFPVQDSMRSLFTE